MSLINTINSITNVDNPSYAYYYYTAVAGDLIIVTITGSNNGNATIVERV